MAVVSVNEITEQRTGITTLAGPEFVRAFIVVTDSPQTGPQTILEHADIPRRLTSTYSSGDDSYPAAKCKEITCTPRDSSRLTWTVTAKYDTTTTPFPDPSQIENTNPLNEPALYTIGNQQIRAIAAKDLSGDTILNSAGCMFDPPVEVDNAMTVLSIQKNIPYTPLADAIEYINCINDSSWQSTGDAYCWRIIDIGGSGPHYQDDGSGNLIEFWRAKYDFLYNPKTWILEVADTGYYELKYAKLAKTKANLVRISTNLKVEINEPWPLKPDGTAADPDVDGVNYLKFHYYREINFVILWVH